MSERFGKYDSGLQMFVEGKPREMDEKRAGFIRWLAEHDRLSTGAKEEELAVQKIVEPIKSASVTTKPRYDASLQMFVQTEHELDQHKVKFMRYLAEQGRLEHPVVSEPQGELVEVFNAANHKKPVSVAA